jgi:hypothetical protein
MLLERPRTAGDREERAPESGALHLTWRHALLLIVAVGAIVRFATLGTQGFWRDEWLTIGIISQGPGGIVDQTINHDTSPPLYFLVAAGWERVFGSGEFALRSLSALFGTATIPAVYAAGAALGSRRAGLVAAALTTASPLMIWYSQEARPYALFAFLAALSFLFFVQALRGGGRRWLWGWAIASTFALSTHYFAIVLIGVEAAWLLWRLTGSRRTVAIAIGVVAAVSLALLPIAAARQDLADWISAIDLGERFLQLPQHFVMGFTTPWEVLPVLVASTTAAVAFFAFARASASTRRIATLSGAVALGGAGVALIAALGGADYLISRNLIELWAPAAVALGALLGGSVVDRLGRPAANRAGPATAAALCILGLALTVWNATTPSAGRPDWAQLTEALGPPTEKRVIASHSTSTSPLGLYLEGAWMMAPGESTEAAELDVIQFESFTDHGIGPCWWVGSCGGELAVPEFSAPPRRSVLVDEGSTSLFRYRRYRISQPVKLPPEETAEAWVQPPS